MIHPRLDAFYTKFFLRDRQFFLLFAGAVGVNALIWTLLALGLDTFRPSDTEYITLHYKIIFGTDFIARWETIFLIPGLGVFFIAVNMVVGRSMYHIQKTLSNALMLTALFGNVVLFFALYLLLRVNQ